MNSPVPQDVLRGIALAQRAAGVVAARRRGDQAGAGALISEFGDPAEQAMGFYLVADLAVLLLAQATDRTVQECVNDLALALALGEDLTD